MSTILLIEDEMIIALDLEQTLMAAGFVTVGPVRSVEEALHSVEKSGFDAALVDLELQGSLATPVVQRLRERGIPFAFITGFERADLPEQFGTEMVIAKPWDPEDLVKAVAQLCRAAGRPLAGRSGPGCAC